MTLLFSDEDDKILVDQVAKFPGLWLVTHPDNKNQIMKENAWIDIADKVGKPIEHCKKRWKNIRDTHDRRRNKKVEPGAPPKKGKKWALEERLSFLKLIKKYRGSSFKINTPPRQEGGQLDESSLPDVDLTSQICAPALATSPIRPNYNDSLPDRTTRQKRKKSQKRSLMKREKKDSKRKRIMETLLLAGETEDDVDLFFKSLAQSVKKFRPDLRRRAKVETLGIINKLEAEMCSSGNFSSSNTYDVQNQSFSSDVGVSVSNALSAIFNADRSHHNHG